MVEVIGEESPDAKSKIKPVTSTFMTNFHTLLGNAYAKVGKYEEAITAYKAALSYVEKQNHAILYEKMASCHLHFHHISEAEEAYRKIFELQKPLSKEIIDLKMTPVSGKL